MGSLEDGEVRRVLLEKGASVYSKRGMVGFEQWVRNYPDSNGMGERMVEFYTYVAKRNGAVSTRVFGISEVLIDEFFKSRVE